MIRGVLLTLGALALLLVVTGLFVRYEHKQANDAEIRYAEQTGRADAAVESAQRADQAAGYSQTKADAAEKVVSDLRAKLAEAQRPHVQPSSPGESSDHSLGGSGLPASADPVDVDVLKDELIQAQDKQISALKVQVFDLTTARDAWHKAHDERAAECVQLQASLAAQKGLASGNLWKGRIEGFAVGVASGYVAGRFR